MGDRRTSPFGAAGAGARLGRGGRGPGGRSPGAAGERMEQKVREERFQAAVAWVRGLPAAGAGDGARVSNQVSQHGLCPPSTAGRTALGSADRRSALSYPNPRPPSPPDSPR